MEEKGWVSFYRKILDNPTICKDSDYFAVWGYLLLNATHDEMKILFQGEEKTIKPGQLITGRKKIAEKFNINESKVQRILKTFENEHQIEQQSSNKNRLITIVSWNKYQQDEQQNEQQLNNNRTTIEQQVNTNKNVKNIKNDKNVTTISDSCVDGLQEVIDFYSNNIGFLNPYGLKILESYVEDMSSELVIYAMQIAVENNKKTISYIKAILNNWAKANIKT